MSRDHLDNWTEARVALLRQLWPTYEPAGAIARGLNGLPGPNITRSAVLGKAQRLGLGHKPGGNSNDTVATPRVKVPPKRSPYHFGGTVTPRDEAQDQPEPRVYDRRLAEFNDAIPVETRKTITSVGDTDCHWPVGDVGDLDFFFCGLPAQDARPYCKFHYFKSVK